MYAELLTKYGGVVYLAWLNVVKLTKEKTFFVYMLPWKIIIHTLLNRTKILLYNSVRNS